MDNQILIEVIFAFMAPVIIIAIKDYLDQRDTRACLDRQDITNSSICSI